MVNAEDIPKNLDGKIQNVVDNGEYGTKVEFIRDACRRRLEQLPDSLVESGDGQ